MPGAAGVGEAVRMTCPTTSAQHHNQQHDRQPSERQTHAAVANPDGRRLHGDLQTGETTIYHVSNFALTEKRPSEGKNCGVELTAGLKLDVEGNPACTTTSRTAKSRAGAEKWSDGQ
jgi:hypothetical protein